MSRFFALSVAMLFFGVAVADAEVDTAADPLVIASDRAWPPFTFTNEAGEPDGMLVDLWRAIGERLGRPVRFRAVDWGETLELVRSGEADLHAGLFRSPERDSYLDFSDKLVPLSTTLFVAAPLPANGFEGLTATPVGVTRGGFEADYVREYYPDIILREYASNRGLVEAAVAGEIQAFVADYPVGMYFLHRFGTPEQYRVVDTLYRKYLHSAVAEGNDELLALINRGLAQLPAEEMERITQKWVRTEQVTPAWFLPLLLTLGGAFLVGGVLGYTVLLRRQVARRTAELSREVEERRAAERSLRESEQSYRNLFNTMRDSVYIQDLNGRFIDVNEAVALMYGYPREYFVGRSPVDLAAPGRNDLDQVKALFAKAVEGAAQRFEFWGRRANGEVFPKEVVVSPGQYGGQPVVIAVSRDITDRKQVQRRLEEMAYLDPLTRLPNRRMLGERMAQALAAARRKGTWVAVCYIDLDDFKTINDARGHDFGDKVLVAVAERLKRAVRGADTAARLGGDEFVVLIDDLPPERMDPEPLDRLLAVLAEPLSVDGEDCRLSASVGVTLFPEDDEDPDTLLRHADQAMYHAKQEGRNRYHFFDSLHDREVHATHEARQRIGAAIAAGELRLYYQPKVDMRREQVVGVEALVRWQHPQRGLLPPVEFLPYIEGHELLRRLDAWVLREAVTQLARWRERGLDLNVSVNVSARSLQQADFLPTLQGLLAETPAAAGHLSLEILETAALDDLAQVSAVIEQCTDMGVEFALDDFGTGYSSLTYFRHLPARMLKIDRSFVRDMLEDPDDLGIVEGIIRLAQVFERCVIAEGVETDAHGVKLLELGCDLAQGYGIARPMPADEVPAWLSGFTPPESWRRAR